ncbi:MAG TPA: TRAP transporter substrate-binding protein [Bacteroides sp.]|nr:TRAP transporter substrate-binding protein [Bacteroides sp.]
MKIRTCLYLTLLILPLMGCRNQQEGRVLKLAHGLDPSHPVHHAMEFMADRCKEISGEQLTLEIYPSGQLGSEQQCVELLQIGSLAITKVSSAVMESFTEDFQVFGLPYIFRSREHYFKVLDSEIGDDILRSAEPYWIRGLCFYDAGSRSFYTIDRPINHPDDLKGLKLRVMKSITAMNMVKSLGGSPTPISWGELYTALQSGVVDGAENNPPSFYTSHHYEVCKFFSLNEHTSIPDVLIVSLKVWEKLSDQEKMWLQQAADESVQVERELWAESEKKSLEIVQEEGVTVVYPDKEPFARKVEPLLESYRDNRKIYDLITRIREVQADEEPKITIDGKDSILVE